MKNNEKVVVFGGGGFWEAMFLIIYLKTVTM